MGFFNPIDYYLKVKLFDGLSTTEISVILSKSTLNILRRFQQETNANDGYCVH
jgi:hypothetical protein